MEKNHTIQHKTETLNVITKQLEDKVLAWVEHPKGRIYGTGTDETSAIDNFLYRYDLEKEASSPGYEEDWKAVFGD